jgi:hypothetical protein
MSPSLLSSYDDFDLSHPLGLEPREAPKGRGDWMQTYTGQAFFPADPRPEEICIEDIAHALSLLCRYGGHCDRFYSVAEHSYWVSYMVPPEHALKALMHDAPEGYLVDVPRPAKVLLGDYRELEGRIWYAICAAFNLSPVMPDEVHEADNAILFSERDQNMAPPPYAWKLPDPGYRIKVKQWGPAKAERMFLKRWRELTNQQTWWEGTCNAAKNLVLDFLHYGQDGLYR